jgi:hypothetical protein
MTTCSRCGAVLDANDSAPDATLVLREQTAIRLLLQCADQLRIEEAAGAVIPADLKARISVFIKERFGTVEKMSEFLELPI